MEESTCNSTEAGMRFVQRKTLTSNEGIKTVCRAKKHTLTKHTHMRQTCGRGLKGLTSHCYSDLPGVRVPASVCESHSSYFITFPRGHKVLSNLTVLKGTLHIF